MPVTGLASPLQPVSSDRPALRNAQTRFASVWRLEDDLAQAQLAPGQRGQAVLDLVEELDHQDGLARLEIQLQQIARGLELQLPAGLVEQHPVKVLDGGGFEVEQLDRRLHRLGHRGEEDQPQALLLRQRHDLQFRRRDGRQRAFAAAEQMIEVVRLPHAAVNGVTGPALRASRRQALGNLQAVEIDQVAPRARAACARCRASARPPRPAHRPARPPAR